VRPYKLTENIFSLYIVHIVRLLLPLLLFPVLVRRVSDDTFSLYILSIAVSAWLSVFVEYGFNISATRDITETEKTEEITKIVSGVHSAKLLLAFLSIFFVALLYQFVPQFNHNILWLLCSWLSSLAIALVPSFYFQGTENTKPLAMSEVISGIVLLVGVFSLVVDESDAEWVPFLFLIARLVTLLVVHAILFKKLSIRIYVFDLKAAVTVLVKGWHCFVLQALASMYTSFNVVMLGFWGDVQAVAIYGAGERLIRAALGFVGQATNAVFPRISRLKHEGCHHFEKYRIFTLIGFAFLGGVGVVFAHILSPHIIYWLFNGELNQAIEVVTLLSWVILVIALSNVLAFQFLLIEKMEKFLNAFVGFGGLLNLVLAYSLVPDWGYMGMAWAWLLVELFILLGLLVTVMWIRLGDRNIA